MQRHGPTCLYGRVPLALELRTFPTLTTQHSDELPLFGLRLKLIERVRLEISEGTYDTHEKWEQALDRLFDEME